MVRITRNLDGMAREKATFESWMAVKQQEIEKIAEVVDLCSKPEAVRPVSALLAKAAVAGAGSQYLRHWICVTGICTVRICTAKV